MYIRPAIVSCGFVLSAANPACNYNFNIWQHRDTFAFRILADHAIYSSNKAISSSLGDWMHIMAEESLKTYRGNCHCTAFVYSMHPNGCLGPIGTMIN